MKGELSRAEEAKTHVHMDKLEAAFARGLEQVKARIGKAVAGAMSNLLSFSTFVRGAGEFFDTI